MGREWACHTLALDGILALNKGPGTQDLERAFLSWLQCSLSEAHPPETALPGAAAPRAWCRARHSCVHVLLRAQLPVLLSLAGAWLWVPWLCPFKGGGVAVWGPQRAGMDQ